MVLTLSFPQFCLAELVKLADILRTFWHHSVAHIPRRIQYRQSRDCSSCLVFARNPCNTRHYREGAFMMNNLPEFPDEGFHVDTTCDKFGQI